MINILPDTMKSELRAAHSNIILLRYILVLLLGATFLALLCGGIFLILTDTENSAKETISFNEQRNSSYTSAKNQADTLRSSLSSAKTILDSEVRYSKVLTSVAAIMPEGTIIDTLSLTPALLDTPTTLTVLAKSREVALKLVQNLQASPVFSNVSLQSISDSTLIQGYGATVSVNLTINKAAGK